MGPGSGKLTTAKALLNRINGRLFDNHAAIDVARSVFDFGAPGFWELVQRVRALVLDAAAEGSVSLLITTFVYVEPDDLVTLELFEAIMARHGGQLLAVLLQCSTAEIIRRSNNADRVARRKMISPQSLRDFMAQHQVRPVPRPTLVLDSEANAAEANAQRIIDDFGLLSCLVPGAS